MYIHISTNVPSKAPKIRSKKASQAQKLALAKVPQMNKPTAEQLRDESMKFCTKGRGRVRGRGVEDPIRSRSQRVHVLQ